MTSRRLLEAAAAAAGILGLAPAHADTPASDDDIDRLLPSLPELRFAHEDVAEHLGHSTAKMARGGAPPRAGRGRCRRVGRELVRVVLAAGPRNAGGRRLRSGAVRHLSPDHQLVDPGELGAGCLGECPPAVAMQCDRDQRGERQHPADHQAAAAS
ncbi:MAG: hypothetical protein U1E40_17395 [Amaricoccus sp.]